MNNIVLSGRLTRELELRKANEKSVISGTIAVNRDKEHTDFINFTAWEKIAESLVNNTTKGSRIIISGSLQSRTYENKEGNKITAWEVLVKNADIIDFKESLPDVPFDYEVKDEDIPF